MGFPSGGEPAGAIKNGGEGRTPSPPFCGIKKISVTLHCARKNGRCGYAVKLARSRSMDSATSIVSCHVMKGLSFFPSRRRRQSSRTS